MSTNTAQTTLNRQRLLVRGLVQGVGFRPSVYVLARRYGLAGFVGNNSEGVFIEIEGEAGQLSAFRHALIHQPPPHAHIDRLECLEIPVLGAADFSIVESEPVPGGQTFIAPDLCVCADCLAEFNDPQNRRYRYPFINCTHCGPRFSIIRELPYDRPMTTMWVFEMCAECAGEYHDPLDRRFHAQPNACPECGPRVNFVAAGQASEGEAAIQAALAALRVGQIVAVKGIGGFHLACDATSEAAVMRLRVRKGRPAKPFAIMVRDLKMAGEVAELSPQEAALLEESARPIVLLKKRPGALPEALAPGNNMLGLMLPYTPLHHLLLEDGPLVMTSANHASQPMIADNQEALASLKDIADAFLLHDRDIHARCDDSVMRVFAGRLLPLRRSRGYVPGAIHLPCEVPSLLAVGGELKNTFCLAQGRRAFMSQHIGDMQTLETQAAFEQAYAHLSSLLAIVPEWLVCDKHPDYLSTRWAQAFSAAHGLPLITVQHHHAHIAVLMAEHGLHDAIIGFSFDGTGYGDDGTIWGGEVLLADYRAYERVAHLPSMPLPGGDVATREIQRLALAWLWANDLPWDEDLPGVKTLPEAQARVLRRQLETGLNVVQTSSIGRLFDVVAALCGLRQSVSYEAQAAIELESIAMPTDETYPFDWLSLKPLLAAIVADVHAGISPARIAGKFHNALADAVLIAALEQRERTGINQVGLSGGVFQNLTLLNGVGSRLLAAGFEVFTHHQVPPNDGGLALGQVMIAAHTM